MSLIHTINRAGKRLFVHFHDEAEFKETEHPRAKSGQFTKKGTGGTGGGVKPKAAPGAVVVNPVAKVLKEHGYEKQKGSNTYKHPTGHEVEVHAASEGQKWLTGWTHGTTGNTGSGAGKLDKHLGSLPGSMSIKMPAFPIPSAVKQTPKPTEVAKPHPLSKVHSVLSNQGFVPTNQDGYETEYTHNNKGKVVINNKAPASGKNEGKVKWSYYANPYDFKPTETGNGVADGSLDKAINKHAPEPTPTPATKSDVVKPSWAKYENSEGSLWPGLYGGEKESAIRYYAGEANNATETLIIGTGENTKGQWQLYTKEGGVIATGEGQESLNQAFENLHPRGEGGKFVAKPDNVSESDHNTLVGAGYKPLGKAPWGQGKIEVYGKDDGSILLSSPLPNGMQKTIFPPHQKALEDEQNIDLLTQMLDGKIPKVGVVPEGSSTEEFFPPTKVSMSGFDPVIAGNIEQKMFDLNQHSYHQYLDEEGFLPTKDMTNHFKFEKGDKVVYVAKTNSDDGPVDWVLSAPDISIKGNGAYNLSDKLGELGWDAAQSPPPTQAPSNTETTNNTLSSLFSPFKAKGFDINSSADGVVGILQNDPKVKMAFSYYPKENKGLVSTQVVGDPAGSKTEVFNGTAAEFYNKVVEHHDTATAGPALPKVQHFTANDPLPAELHGVAFAPYTPPTDWTNVEGTNEHLQEPPLSPPPGKKVSCGVLIEEPDGRVWLVKPKDEYGGYKYTFPKGGQELGLSMQQTALKEAWEESGLKAEITGYAGDYLGDTSITRYYYAKRTGGTPTGYQPSETEQVTLVPKEELHQYLNKARDLQIAKDHFTPKAIGRVIHFNSMVKVGEKKGSNPGGIYQSPSGKKYYIKMPKSNQHAANELLAAELMAKAGGGTLKYHQIVDNGKNYVGTEWENLQKDNVSKLSLNERKMAQSDFAINAWLANWDSAGTGGDNTGILNGKPVTLDVGGALLYRAQGTPKGALFGDNPTEWGTLRDATVNPDAAKLYGDMTPQQMKESAEKLNNITNKDIQDAVHNHFDVQDIVGDDLIDKLIARRDKIIQWGALIPATPKPYVPPSSAQTIAAQSAYKPTPPPTPTYTQANPGPKGHDDPDGLRRKVAAWNPPNKPSTAIQAYKGSHYDPMNALMRFGALEDDDQSSEAQYIRQATNWLDKASTQEELVVYRKVPKGVVDQWNKFAKVGRPLRDPGFQSTSTSKQFADNWDGPGITLRINMPKGTKAATVRNTNESDGEYEVLLQNGTILRINSWQPGKYDVTVEQPHLKKGTV